MAHLPDPTVCAGAEAPLSALGVGALPSALGAGAPPSTPGAETPQLAQVQGPHRPHQVWGWTSGPAPGLQGPVCWDLAALDLTAGLISESRDTSPKTNLGS